MTELIPTASEAEWLAARRQGITASEIPIIMGLAPWSSPYALYHQKLGILPGDDDSPMMERGRVLEPYIAEKFAAAHPEFITDGTGRELYRHGDRAWQMATPDRLVSTYEIEWETNGTIPLEVVALAEFKTASSWDEWGEPGTDEIPVHYRCQVLWQMDVMGVHVAYVTVLNVPLWEIREYIVQHDESPVLEYPHTPDTFAPSVCRACGDVELMLKAAEDFLLRLEDQQAPDVDYRPATLGALKALHPSVEDFSAEIGPQLADRYEAAVRNYKHWEQRKQLYEAQLREAMGSAHRAVRKGPGQVPVARRDVYEVRESTRRAFTMDRLVATPPKPKKES